MSKRLFPQVSLPKRLLFSFALAALGMCAAQTEAQVTPINVPDAGVGPLTFDTQPTLANGWSTVTWPSGNGDITSVTAMDTAANTNAAAGIATVLGSSATVNPPSANAIFRWNSANHYIQSRPTGNAYTILLGTFRNASSGDKSSFILDYTFGAEFLAGTTEGEDPGLEGHRVYYSLTGAPGTWTHIPQFDGGLATAGPKHAQITLATPWEVGSDLYIIWTDDNGVPGSSGTSGPAEGAYTIDNLQLTFQVTPVSIVTQPHDIAVEQCRSSNLTVTATGTGPITYQWYKNGAAGAIAGATSPTYTFANAQLTDSGTYFVRVTGPGANNTVESTHVTVTVNQDTAGPTVTSALGRIDGTNVVVTFSEALDPLTATDPTLYFLSPAAGGAEAQPISAVLSSGNTVVTLAFAEARAAGVNYNLLIIPALADCAGNPLSGEDNGDGRIRVPLHYEIHLINFDNEAYKYDHSGIDLGIDWYSSAYDDSTWSNGLSVFDAKSTPRTAVGGKNVATQLPLHFGTYTTDDVPVYYFRKFFSLPVPLSHISSVSLRTFVDDFDVAYLNDNPTPVHVRAGLIASPDSYGYAGGSAVGDAGVEGPFNIPLTSLVDGQNFLAVKVFQQTNTSSDITFAYELDAVVDSVAISTGPQLQISKDANTGAVTITWAAGSGAALYEADAVDAPAASWTSVAGASDGSYTFTPPATGGTQKFYVLRK